MSTLGNFFFNTEKNDGDTPVDSAVSSPAFSTTKVLTAASVIVTPLATWLVKLLEGQDFSLQPAHVVAIILGLLGFIAIIASADVLARAIAASAQSRGDAMATIRDSENLIPFDKHLRATLTDVAGNPEVQVLAAAGGACPHFLIKKEDESLTWTLTSKVRVLGAS